MATPNVAMRLGHLGQLHRSAALAWEERGPWQHSYGAATRHCPDQGCLPLAHAPVQVCQMSKARPLGGYSACGKKL